MQSVKLIEVHQKISRSYGRETDRNSKSILWTEQVHPLTVWWN